ncbi:uncharacterized protein si:dkeyp-51f12.2 [Polypterus senegalus]|uniref:uncharacterized protein si:dkeyp-51f12.2 n=1 Tax=Polypterus senegalus TaxID=55291 RepID=UPI001963F534|nr:uncharacterized protein si:dkeyp-51f12.2 [Polypterus senegalus]
MTSIRNGVNTVGLVLLLSGAVTLVCFDGGGPWSVLRSMSLCSCLLGTLLLLFGLYHTAKLSRANSRAPSLFYLQTPSRFSEPRLLFLPRVSRYEAGSRCRPSLPAVPYLHSCPPLQQLDLPPSYEMVMKSTIGRAGLRRSLSDTALQSAVPLATSRGLSTDI